MNIFISFEGIDYSGKSTQCERVGRWLRETGHPVLMVREPGGTEVSEHIRSLLLDLRHQAMTAETELLLFSAARSQLVVEKIRPALEEGIFVLVDRFLDSSTAYQGYGRGIPIDAVECVHKLATHGVLPDLSFFFDISFQESLSRRPLAGRTTDRIERANAEFFEAVQRGYYMIAHQHPERMHVIDGTQEVALISEQLITMIQAHPRYRKERQT